MTSDKKRFQILSLSLVLGLAAAIGSLLFLGWLSDEVMDGDTRQFDEATRAFVHQFASPPFTQIMRGISFLGSTIFLTSLTALFVVGFAVRQWRREAILMGITMAGAALLDVTLKYAFHRARPVPYFDIVAPRSYSFPSGHALASFCCYGALAAILSPRIKSPPIKAALWIVCALLVLAIGFSRIYLGVHYPTDVLAGYSAALIWIFVVRFVDVSLARRREKTRQRKA